ncbi:MAG: RluA family pseudouridine synthase [Thermoleophilia bacterium]|nr:RluA family pseudouridine synthase [Gaiellaceae bacterium]MDW8338651.1 RluA family pseudouridine synthase [Thermoleophilia bacterium]
MRALRFEVAESEAGRRLDSVLASHPEIGSRSLAERLIGEGAVRVDGVSRPKSHRLRGRAVVEVVLPDGEERATPGQPTVPVVWADDALLVVDKPAGLVVHAGAGARGPTLADALVRLGATGGPDPARPGIVHRLDRGTSGLLVVARSEETWSRLVEAIRRREVERRYLALVRGRPRSRSGRIDAPIGRDRRDPTRQSLDTDEPKEAVTFFEVLETLPEHALLDVRLETGRTHQVRVHLAAIGLPVAGDATYGAAGDLGLERQFLHAHRLRLAHPLTGEELSLSSPLPEDLERALARARTARPIEATAGSSARRDR